jgi:polyether ionophore transport system permease protein
VRRSEVYDDAHAARAVATSAAKRASRAGALWGLVFGVTIASSAMTYTAAFPTAASRAALAETFQGNAGFNALFGAIHNIDTVPGYTAYKSLYTMIVLGAIWGLLIATRLTRGDEDAGRWELFLSGHTTRAAATRQVAIGLGVGIAALWLPTALITAAAGAGSKVGIGVGAAFFYAAAGVSAAAMFMAVGMFVGQLAATRHDANVIGAGILAGSYLIRMVADSAPGLNWLRWASPFGWIEELRPLTGSHLFAFVPIGAFVIVLVVLAIRIAAGRDLGTSPFTSRDRSKPRTLLLGGEAGLTVRLSRPVIVVWLVALSITGLVFGLVAQAAGSALHGSPGIEDAIERLGGTSAGVASYLGFVFVVAAGLVAIAVAGQIAAARNEEAAGHLDNLLVRPVARWRWLGFRLAVGAGLVVVASSLVGVGAWVGAVSQQTGIGFGDLLKAGLNVAPPAVFVLGIGGLAFGLWPRGAIGVAYGLVVWSFLVETLSALVDSNHWLRDTSPMLHIAPVPAADPNWTAAAWLVGLGVLAAIAGILAFGRRDLAGA